MDRVKQWAKIREGLKSEFKNRGITRCEVCGDNLFCSFHHRRKRVEYYKTPKLLGSFKEVILVCCRCHTDLEYDREKTREVFKKLRGK